MQTNARFSAYGGGSIYVGVANTQTVNAPSPTAFFAQSDGRTVTVAPDWNVVIGANVTLTKDANFDGVSLAGTGTITLQSGAFEDSGPANCL